MDSRNNPALKDVAFLVGDWSIELSNASFLSDKDQKPTFSVTYEWKADGAVIAVQQRNGTAKPPQVATWIIGRDESDDNYTVLYADHRGVSRVYQMSFQDNTWKMWRNNSKFSQRFEGKVSEDRGTIQASWEKSLDGGSTWEHDFDMTYRRI
jgi:hypothetical protein